MKLQQLRYVLAIVDNDLSMTTAARCLYTSQPGISKQIKLLEAELGWPIFVRKGKNLKAVTPTGDQIVRHARIIMREVEDLLALKAA